MNRPEVLNAINTLMLQELTEAVEELADDQMIRCVVLTGAGRAFGSGQDITEFGSAFSVGEHQAREHLAKYHRLISAIRQMPRPVIAAIQGVATGISLIDVFLWQSLKRQPGHWRSDWQMDQRVPIS